MRTSLNETEHIEKYLQGKMRSDQSTLMEARMILYPGLRSEVKFQKITYSVIREYGRKKLLENIRKAEKIVFTEPAHGLFQHKIRALFSKL